MESTVPPYSVIDLAIQDEEGSLVLMCNGSRFCIDVHLADLRDASESFPNRLEEQFIHFRDNLDEDATIMEMFDEWAVDPCLTFIRQQAPKQIDRKNFTLKDYYEPPTHFIKLANVGGSLQAMWRPDDGFLLRHLTPQISPSSLTVPPEQLKDVDRVDPSQLYVVPGDDPTRFEFCAIPRAVQAKGSNNRLFFKAAFDTCSFNRELEVYLRFKDRIHSSRKTPIPDLVSLVQWEDGSFLGFVTRYIHHTTSFRGAAKKANLRTRTRWMKQIEATVSELHGMDLVWGDVKPENVVIDVDGNAHVVDFGGGYSPKWVDDALSETKEGDLQGISRLREFLGIE